MSTLLHRLATARRAPAHRAVGRDEDTRSPPGAPGRGRRYEASGDDGAYVCLEDEVGQALRPGRVPRLGIARAHPHTTSPAVRVSGSTGRLSVAGLACLKSGRPGRFFYHLRVNRRRKDEHPSLSEADYAHPITTAHHALGVPVILIWDNLNTRRSQKMRAFTEAAPTG